MCHMLTSGSVMTGLMAALGAQNMPQGGDGSGRGGPGGENVPAPFMNLFQSLGLIPGGGQMGDFVYSQEGLDRIVSQLMEQTATNNAPPPATQADIDALPRKKVSEDMLGPEHTAECSICMDEVNIGEQVTELPCKHWFHHPCVSAWLIEHDTCPHCRKGITTHPESGASAQASASGGQASTASQPSGSRSMPGAFEDVSGAGTSQDPYIVPSDAGSTGDQATGTSTATDTAPGGLGDRIRRGWFSPPS
jgi:E3 ubiquitin-protein ligase RNF115/126